MGREPLTASEPTARSVTAAQDHQCLAEGGETDEAGEHQQFADVVAGGEAGRARGADHEQDERERGRPQSGARRTQPGGRLVIEGASR